MRTAFGCRIKRYAMTSFDAWQTNFVSDSIRCGTNRRGWHRFGAWQTNFVPDSIRCGTNRRGWHRFGAWQTNFIPDSMCCGPNHRGWCLLGCRLFCFMDSPLWLMSPSALIRGFLFHRQKLPGHSDRNAVESKNQLKVVSRCFD